MTDTAVVVGIDVAKARLDAAVVGAQVAAAQFANDAEGHTALMAWLEPLAPALVVLEATGGYEALAVCALQAAGLAVAVVNPRQAHAFGKALGYLAKTDRIDAVALAELGRMLLARDDLRRYLKPLTSAEQRVLAALGAGFCFGRLMSPASRRCVAAPSAVGTRALRRRPSPRARPSRVPAPAPSYRR